MSFQTIVTIGPSLMEAKTLQSLDTFGPCLYRINGAHSDPENVRELTEYLRNSLKTPQIILDLPGNKVRMKNLGEGLPIQKGKPVQIQTSQLNYPDFYRFIKAKDEVRAHDSTYWLEVERVEPDTITLLSHHDGILKSGKGLHVPGAYEELPFLFDRDRDLIQMGNQLKLDFVSLSFARTAEDVLEAKELIDESSTIITKIETKLALENLATILDHTKMINVDRGDLSSDIGMNNIPRAQKRIIDTAHQKGAQVFLATQFLKNMEKEPVPLIAEITNLFQTIQLNISGIQLSEETAVGAYPKECVQLVFEMAAQARN